MQLGLHFALAAGLALLAWICGLDGNGTALEQVLLWGAAALVSAPLVRRFVFPAR
jgi:hypothetical protein